MEMLTFAFRYVKELFNREGERSKLGALYGLVQAGTENLLQFDPVKKVPVYDQHLVKPQTDTTLIRVTEDIFVPLFISCS
jgi:hypothetical protein